MIQLIGIMVNGGPERFFVLLLLLQLDEHAESLIDFLYEFNYDKNKLRGAIDFGDSLPNDFLHQIYQTRAKRHTTTTKGGFYLETSSFVDRTIHLLLRFRKLNTQ